MLIHKIDKHKVELAVNTLRILSADAVEKAQSGHPGLPMGFADVAFILWMKFLRFNPEDPQWPNRDRFVLSAGHGSMLLYSLLNLFGYDLSLDDIKQFRQFGSKTPGHPEYGHTNGVEATTGPLGQGFANGDGMALVGRLMAEQFNTGDAKIIDHYIYGEPLGAKELELTKESLGWPKDKTFYIPAEIKQLCNNRVVELKEEYENWQTLFKKYIREDPKKSRLWDTCFKKEIPENLESELLKTIKKYSIATRTASGEMMQVIARS